MAYDSPELTPAEVAGVTPNVDLWAVAIGGRFLPFPTEAAARKGARDAATKSPGEVATVLRPFAEIRATVNVEEKAL